MQPATESLRVLVLVGVCVVAACQRGPLGFQAWDGEADSQGPASRASADDASVDDLAASDVGRPPQADGGERDVRLAADHRAAPESNCATNADCPRGFRCSPSQLIANCFCPVTALCDDSGQCFIGTTPAPCVCGDACGHGYFCHTANDTCNDDADCTQGTCNYNWVDESWSCSDCWPHSIQI
jgi:hypothetical protein